MSTIMNTHMSGTNTRTAFSMVSVPRQSSRIVSVQIVATAIMGHHVEIMPKNQAVALVVALGSRNGAKGALAPGSRSDPKAPTNMLSAHPRMVM